MLTRLQRHYQFGSKTFYFSSLNLESRFINSVILEFNVCPFFWDSFSKWSIKALLVFIDRVFVVII